MKRKNYNVMQQDVESIRIISREIMSLISALQFYKNNMDTFISNSVAKNASDFFQALIEQEEYYENDKYFHEFLAETYNEQTVQKQIKTLSLILKIIDLFNNGEKEDISSFEKFIESLDLGADNENNE